MWISAFVPEVSTLSPSSSSHPLPTQTLHLRRMRPYSRPSSGVDCGGLGVSKRLHSAVVRPSGQGLVSGASHQGS
ncbi:hypothetical protein M408DRAFT_328189 [Serendipita vermifera MAFF 305830]|uniref:Uncharacterized protein n=1 Tax=Serendipita vermifera MAFF 305830 TaxID=933852 RepID=A0A0C2XNW9_SERVB|nr:hypothetical protein M408DRAFT_328189 [Serendipita vermifera MAFF 305830]